MMKAPSAIKGTTDNYYGPAPRRDLDIGIFETHFTIQLPKFPDPPGAGKTCPRAEPQLKTSTDARRLSAITRKACSRRREYQPRACHTALSNALKKAALMAPFFGQLGFCHTTELPPSTAIA